MRLNWYIIEKYRSILIRIWMYTHMQTFIHICTSMIQGSLETSMSKNGIPPKPPTTISFCGTTRNEGANFWRHQSLAGCWKIRSSSCRQLDPLVASVDWAVGNLIPQLSRFWVDVSSIQSANMSSFMFFCFLRHPLHTPEMEWIDAYWCSKSVTCVCPSAQYRFAHGVHGCDRSINESWRRRSGCWWKVCQAWEMDCKCPAFHQRPGFLRFSFTKIGFWRINYRTKWRLNPRVAILPVDLEGVGAATASKTDDGGNGNMGNPLDLLMEIHQGSSGSTPVGLWQLVIPWLPNWWVEDPPLLSQLHRRIARWRSAGRSWRSSDISSCCWRRHRCCSCRRLTVGSSGIIRNHRWVLFLFWLRGTTRYHLFVSVCKQPFTRWISVMPPDEERLEQGVDAFAEQHSSYAQCLQHFAQDFGGMKTWPIQRIQSTIVPCAKSIQNQNKLVLLQDLFPEFGP